MKFLVEVPDNPLTVEESVEDIQTTLDEGSCFVEVRVSHLREPVPGKSSWPTLTAQQLAEAIEQLRCAEINCDNAKKNGLIFVDVVKAQVTEALKLLGGTA